MCARRLNKEHPDYAEFMNKARAVEDIYWEKYEEVKKRNLPLTSISMKRIEKEMVPFTKKGGSFLRS